MKKNLSVSAILGLLLSVFVASPAVPEERVETPTPETNFRVQVVNVAIELESAPGGVAVDSGDWMLLKSSEDDVQSSMESGGGEFFDADQLTSSMVDISAVDDGFYRLEINPDASFTPTLTRTNFYVNIQSSVVSITPEDGSGNIAPVNNVFTLPINEANITGNILNPDGTPVVSDFENQVYYEIEVLELQGGSFYGIGSLFMADENGNFAAYAPDGEYKLRFKPFGRTDVATTTTESFVISGDTATFPDQRLSEPMLKVVVRSATGTENLPYVGIDVRQGYDYVDFAFTGPSAATALSFEETGEYELVVNPEWGTTGNSKNTYEVQVTDDGNGNLTAAITGVTPDSDGFHVLRFKEPTISGQVRTPDGSSGVAFSEVLPIRDGEDYPNWEYAAYTDGQGNFSMALPEGTYEVFAKAPWDSSEYGDGLKVGPVVVDSSGSATSLPTGFTADAFNLNLSNPTWSGTVVSPVDNTTPIEGASVCFNPSLFSTMSSCSRTDQDGRFALSADEDFTDFDEGSRLSIDKWESTEFTAVVFEGKSEVEEALGTYSVGQTFENIVLTMALPNFEVTVETPNGDPAARVWVNLQSDFNYIGGKETDANGIARFSLDSQDVADEIYLRTELWGNEALKQEFTESSEVLPPNTLTADSNGLYSYTVTLAVPNFRAIVKKPTDNGPVAVGNLGVEVQSLNNEYNWLNADRNGFVSEDLKPVTGEPNFYFLKVRPPWDSQENLSDNEYIVEVATDGTITSVTESSSNQAASSDTVRIGGVDESAFVLMLKPSNVNGQVVQDDNGTEQGVRDSWIETRVDGTQQYLWEKSTNSKLNGNFGVTLEDGSYELIANAPWYSSKVKSEACDVTVASGAVDVAGSSASCVDGDGNVKLTLRDGNLQMNLLEPDGVTPVRFGHVSVSVGNWYTWAQSDRNGVASLFIDIDEIKLRNKDWAFKTQGFLDDLEINFSFDPPWGDSGMSRWECSTADTGAGVPAVCASLTAVNVDTGFTAPAGPIDVTFPSPNTVITVTDGTDAVGVGAWVSLFEVVGGDRRWIDGGQTDYDGKAYFNVDGTDLTDDYMVEVNPPWNKQNDYSRAEHVLTGDQLNDARLALKTPNLFLDIDAKDGTSAARWSWVQLEEVDASTFAYVSWENGAGANRAGQAALALEPSKTYKLTVYPGDPSAGARTTCIISTDSNSTVSLVSDGATNLCSAGQIDPSDATKLNIDLSAGNVSGTVTDFTDSSKLSGVIVSAKNDTTGEIVEAITNRNGVYSMQLDEGNWTFNFFYAGVASNGKAYESSIGITQTVSSSAVVLDEQLIREGTT